jgi:hypothetical protein
LTALGMGVREPRWFARLFILTPAEVHAILGGLGPTSYSEIAAGLLDSCGGP